MKKFFIYTVTISILFLSYIIYDNSIPISTNKADYKFIDISKGDSIKRIGTILEKEKIIKYRYLFYWYLRFNKLDSKIKMGKYKLSSSNTFLEIINQLIKGSNYEENVKVTFKEGLRISDIGKILEEKEICSYNDFIKTAKFENFKHLINLTPNNNSIEGFLYPDTYFFRKKEKPNAIIERLINRFNKLVNINMNRLKAIKGFTFYELVILSSIVEKEAMVENEKSKIASVFLNRIKLNRKLQSCATINYLYEYPKKVLTLKDLSIESKYNTYKYKNLPPTPICSPSLNTIISVFNPANTNALYFVSKGDGTHHFSRTFKEHKRAKSNISKNSKSDK